MGDIGDSAGTQTQDLQNRNLTLYSTKLRSHGKDNTFAKLMLSKRHFCIRNSLIIRGSISKK